MNTHKKNIAIFISGTGSNMQALINACHDTDYPAKIVCVISDNPDAKGLSIANNLGVQTHYINPRDYATKQAYEAIVHEKLLSHYVDFVCLAGFMRLVSSYLCDLWHGKMINIHPSLLPAFKGLDTHKRAINAGVKFSGCTIHYVSSKMDSGKIIAQAVTPVYRHDTVDILAERILQAEHKLYPLVLAALCNKKTDDDTLSFYHTY
jgi:formyltetrahydrofolate-dependent phosphoribosylglycinamide formyltransferase